MPYSFNQTITATFSAARERVIDALAREELEVITELDMKAYFKKERGAAFRDYRILGVCNAEEAYAALQAESRAGVVLPCKMIVQDVGGGKVGVYAFDPAAQMLAIDNRRLKKIGGDMRDRLLRVMERLKES